MHADTDVPQSLIDELVTAFEQLQPADIARMGDWYDEHARFKDPFKDVQGLAAVQAIFQHMFDTLEQPRFVVTSCLVQGQGCFLVWDFLFRFKTMQPGVVAPRMLIAFLTLYSRSRRSATVAVAT